MISIVIPTHNEASWLPATLDAVAANETPHEVIVVDANSFDNTLALARSKRAEAIESPRKQRAAQMNAGAHRANGDVLLFLHADTLLPPSALERIEAALQNASIGGGAFVRRYDSRSRFLRATCLLADLRGRYSGWFLGDQAIFVRRDIFERIGGFRDLALFEDLDFSRRLAREGRVVMLRPAVISSARRFELRGPLRTTWSDFALTCLYLGGTHPNALATRQHRRAKLPDYFGAAQLRYEHERQRDL